MSDEDRESYAERDRKARAATSTRAFGDSSGFIAPFEAEPADHEELEAIEAVKERFPRHTSVDVAALVDWYREVKEEVTEIVVASFPDFPKEL